MSVIAKVYWRSIKRGTRTLESVPEAVLPEVLELKAAEEATAEAAAATAAAADTEA